jgi:TolB-like protein/DNA-binding winged helix-turn-helix (wHTH) protein/Tfp pilus assembly protein PilF
MPLPAQVVRFGPFELDVPAAELRFNGNKTKLPEQTFQVLTALLEKPGEVVTREELRQRLWGSETFVDFEHGLNAAVKRLRETLGDSAENPRFIETLPRHGYRLIVPVKQPAPLAATPVVAARRWRVWLAVAAVVLVAIVIGLVWRQRRLQRLHPVHIESLAVLPLENLSGNPDEEYFADGMTEALITELGKVHALRVISRQSVMHYKGTTKTVPQIARELNVDAVVEGSALRDGDKVRITTQLIQANPERHLWSESYERSLSDVIVLQREATLAITREVRVTLTRQEQANLSRAGPSHPGSRSAVNAEAQEAYLRGRFLLGRRTGEAFGQAREYFEKTIELEPGYPEAYSGLAIAYLMLPNYQVLRASAAIPRAKAAAQKALELDPYMAEARTVLAEIRSEHEWDFANGEKEFRQVLQDNPNYVLAHQWYAVLLWAMGRFDEGIAEMKKASELAPQVLGITVDLGRAYYFARQTDRAIEQYKKVIELNPSFGTAHSMLGMALLEKRDYDGAIAELRKGISPHGDQSVWLAYAYGLAGRKAEAHHELAACLQRWDQRHTGGVCLALGYLALGDKDRAFQWLEKEFQEHTGTIFMLKAYPYWDRLRSDPRYEDLLRRAGLPS